MAPPAVSFIIPCFNYGRFVGEAVASALAQMDCDVQVVLVDDGSDDGTTPEVCDRLAGDRVRVIHQPNAGPGAARNRGASEAAGEFLVFLDADDTVDPRFVSRLAARIAEESARGGGPVSHAYCQEVLTEQATGTWRVPEWDPLLLMVTNLHPITTLIRRGCFEEVGGFDATLGGNYEDWDLWLKFAQRGYRGVRVAEPLFFWRRHSPDTMVMRAVLRHDETFARLVERHRELYERRALEIVRLTNSMLRRFDCNWIDETGLPIPLQYLRSTVADLAALQARAAQLQQQVEYQRARNDALGAELIEQARLALDAAQLRDHYESYAAIRLYRAWHRWLARLPRPLAWLPRQAARAARLLAK